MNEKTEKYINEYCKPTGKLKINKTESEKVYNTMLEEYNICEKDLIISNLKQMPYNEFLSTPYWQIIAKYVKRKSKNHCIKCDSNEHLNAHHHNYDTHGNEIEHLENLTCICQSCHEKEHTKIIYLAGKISHNCWRHSIVKNLREVSISDGTYGVVPIGYIMEKAIGYKHSYSGPYFIGCDHGCSHGENKHGNGNGCMQRWDNEETRKDDVVTNCLVGIEQCNVFFAYINSLDCYGTLAEIGYAFSKGKKIYIAMDKEYPDLWFVQNMAVKTLIYKTPKESLEFILKNYN